MALVSIDAIPTLAATITDAGVDYLAVKANQPTLLAEADRPFATEGLARDVLIVEWHKGHGCIERHAMSVMWKVDWLKECGSIQLICLPKSSTIILIQSRAELADQYSLKLTTVFSQPPTSLKICLKQCAAMGASRTGCTGCAPTPSQDTCPSPENKRRARVAIGRRFTINRTRIALDQSRAEAQQAQKTLELNDLKPTSFKLRHEHATGCVTSSGCRELPYPFGVCCN